MIMSAGRRQAVTKASMVTVAFRSAAFRRPQQQKCISTNYILDFVLQRPNPLIANLQNVLGPTSSQAPLTLSDDKKVVGDIRQTIPELSAASLEPYHGKKAITQVLGTFQEELITLQGNFSGERDPVALCEQLNRILEPVLFLKMTLKLMASVSELSKKFHWEREYESLCQQGKGIDRMHASWIYEALSEASRTSENEEIRWSAQILRSELESLYAPQLSSSSENSEKFAKLNKAIESTARDFDENCQKMNPSKETIGLMYNLVGMMDDRAKLLGFNNFTSQIWSQDRRMASAPEIEELEKETTEQLSPLLNKIFKRNTKSPAEMALDEYLQPTQQADSKPQKPILDPTSDPILQDEMMQLKFQQHVTLEGAMEFLSRLLDDMFSVTLVKDEKIQSWADGVELYHIFDSRRSSNDNQQEQQQQHLGSFYLDPFLRSGKVEGSCTIPVQTRGQHSVPVLAVLLHAQLPVWKDDPISLKWDDLKALFHELGHVLQEVMPRSSCGVTLGSQGLPRDACEIIPHLMEHWLLEKSTIYGLIAASKTEDGFAHEEVDAFYRVLARRKMEEIATVVYYSKLEMTLLSGYDLRGKETIMSLQKRLAQEFVPHDVPHTSDLTPLIKVLQPNAKGDYLCQYSYLWADCVAAQIFESFKEAYSKDESKLPQLRDTLRRLLLHPGAMVPVDEIRSEWAVGNSVSPKALIQRYGLDKSLL
mmetsp:Transcript_15496/g.20177  ORF Transcript_15496/g.20177 Transcript_15496/m.20177 type:complete len:707 (+) Transcript_15496:183-2303(+)